MFRLETFFILRGKTGENEGEIMIKKLINKILHLFGYHLTKMPRPYQRKKKIVAPTQYDLKA